jgi:hypothetical protein
MTLSRRTVMTLLVLASASTTVTVILHPEVDSSGAVLLGLLYADLGRWYAVHALVLVDAALWLFAGAGLATVLWESRPVLARVGGSAVAVGSMALAAIGASEIVLAKVADGTQGAPGAGLAQQFDNAGAVIYLVPAVVLLTVGLAVLCAALWRAGIVPPAWAVAFALGTVLSNPPIPHEVNMAGQVLQTIAALGIAVHLRRALPPAGGRNSV